MCWGSMTTSVCSHFAIHTLTIVGSVEYMGNAHFKRTTLNGGALRSRASFACHFIGAFARQLFAFAARLISAGLARFDAAAAVAALAFIDFKRFIAA